METKGLLENFLVMDGRPYRGFVGWVTVELPEDVHRDAKAEAAMRGEKLYPYLVAKITEGVKRDRKERESDR